MVDKHTCGWCDKCFDARDEAIKHAQVCDDNPMVERIAALEHERDYLDARLAQFELLAEEFVQFQLPDHMCRMRFIQLLNCGKPIKYVEE